MVSPTTPERLFEVFFCYRESPQRRAALAAGAGAPERYLLFGLDELAERGIRVQHNLERPAGAPRWTRLADSVLNRIVRRRGGYGGAFHSVLPDLRRVASIVAYSEHEAALVREVVGEDAAAPPVQFVPFGVDTEKFRPQPEVSADVDVVSIGADPHRDFPVLLRIAARHPELRFLIVGGAVLARELGPLPPNVQLEVDIPLTEVRDRLARARVVALPVRSNSYSGATTVLLQAMAMGKPVVVSRTPAIATGYGLGGGENCVLVEPGDEQAFEQALLGVLADDRWAATLGAAARRLVESELSWTRYVDAIQAALAAAVARH